MTHKFKEILQISKIEIEKRFHAFHITERPKIERELDKLWNEVALFTHEENEFYNKLKKNYIDVEPEPPLLLSLKARLKALAGIY